MLVIIFCPTAYLDKVKLKSNAYTIKVKSKRIQTKLNQKSNAYTDKVKSKLNAYTVKKLKTIRLC